MPSTFSPSLRIELIASGEASGTWGVRTNNNLGDLIEQAIAYTTSVNVTSSDATLTSLNGVVDQARSAVLEVTGTPGVTRVITVPNVQKMYTIRNRTTNIAQIKTASGAAFDCPALSDSYLVCDGANVVVGRSITDGANAITSLAAPFTSPAFLGTPTAPTAAVNTNTTQIATTAFVNAEIASDTANLAPLASPALTGTPTAPTATVGTNTTQLATTAFVNNEIASDTANLAPLASPALTGVPTAPTAAITTNNTQLATTAFVRSILPTGVVLMWSGSIASIPSGWLICDGTSSTPDLRDRFVVGAGTTYAVGNTGGATTNTLIIDNLPAHDHTGSGSTSNVNINHTHSGSTGFQSNDHAHNVTINSGIQSENHTHNVNDPGHLHTQTDTNQSGTNGGNFTSGTNVSAPQLSAYTTQPATTGITLSGNTSNHSHLVSGSTGGISAGHIHEFSTGSMSANAAHEHTYSFTTSSVGSGTAVENRPPYYALAYIMKT